MENNIQNQDTTVQVAKKSFAGTFSGCLGIVAGVNLAWIVGCVVLIVLLFCCCSSIAFIGSIAPTEEKDTTLVVGGSTLIDIRNLIQRPMQELATELKTEVKHGTGEELDRISLEKDNYDLFIESDTSKKYSNFITVIIKNQPKCSKETYNGSINFDNTLKLVGLDSSLKGNVEPYFSRAYASWTRNYNKDYTVNAGCNSEGYIYLNYGLTKCQSSVNGKLPTGC